MVGCIQSGMNPPADDVTSRQIVTPALNLAVQSLSTNAQADVAEGHEIEPAKEKQYGANPVDSFGIHRVMSSNASSDNVIPRSGSTR